MLLIYLLVVIFVLKFLQHKKVKYDEYPLLKLCKNGIIFHSQKVHRIKIGDAKTMQVGNVVYVKRNSQMFIIKNVDNVYLKDEFLYYKSLGIVRIIFNAKPIYRYFNVEIISEKFDILPLKKLALNNLIDNLLDLSYAHILKKFLKLLKNTLKININNTKLSIKQNNFLIPFTIKYKINNKIKVVKVN